MATTIKMGTPVYKGGAGGEPPGRRGSNWNSRRKLREDHVAAWGRSRTGEASIKMLLLGPGLARLPWGGWHVNNSVGMS